ncbi:MAG: 50S ribosomal protein L2 [Fimbriiglobus sp.]
MAIRNYKPTSAGRRSGSVLDFSECTNPGVNAPAKHLLKPRKKKGGRNNQGVTTTRFRGGGHKQKLRVIDFKRKKDAMEAVVLSVEYDPTRSARLALLQYTDGFKAYILAPDGLKAGDKVMSGDVEAVEPRLGNCLPLSRIPLGMTIHNVELTPGRGGQICRSAGCSAVLGARDKGQALLTMPSGEVRKVSVKCRATIGSVSNPEHMNVSLGKAGRKRWMGRKPHNRGTSMNPTDHPMGGGEGRTAGGRNPSSKSGVPSKGGKTRQKRKPSNNAIVRRRPAGPFQTHNG